jgi:hypothetical protein
MYMFPYLRGIGEDKLTRLVCNGSHEVLRANAACLNRIAAMYEFNHGKQTLDVTVIGKPLKHNCVGDWRTGAAASSMFSQRQLKL